MSDLACVLELSSELSQVEEKNNFMYIYICVCLSLLGDLENVSLIKTKVNANTVGKTGSVGLLQSLYVVYVVCSICTCTYVYVQIRKAYLVMVLKNFTLMLHEALIPAANFLSLETSQGNERSCQCLDLQLCCAS